MCAAATSWEIIQNPPAGYGSGCRKGRRGRNIGPDARAGKTVLRNKNSQFRPLRKFRTLQQTGWQRPIDEIDYTPRGVLSSRQNPANLLPLEPVKVLVLT